MTGVYMFLRQRLAEQQLAVMLLTRLPAGRIDDPVPQTSSAVWAFPVAGLIVGTITALVLYGALQLGLPPQIAAGLALGAGVLATGGLHEDGLADVADGFGGGRDREHKLAIMRDSRIGSFGTLALILVLGMRWSALAHLAGLNRIQASCALVAVAVASRAQLAVALAALPAVRSDGLGHDAAKPTVMRVAMASALGVLALLFCLGATAALWVAVAQLLALIVVARLAMRQIGGQTGDVLGAMQQAADLAAWIMLVWLVH